MIHTIDLRGRALEGHEPTPGHADELGETEVRGGRGELRIVAAVVNPHGHDEGKEQVVLHNAGEQAVDLAGWVITDIDKRREPLSGTLAASASVTVTLSGADARLSNNGGLISVLDPDGIKVDGVSYTRSQAKRRGGRLVF